MDETLKCGTCGKSWSRIKTRGRKPVLCPQCTANATEPPKEIIQNITNKNTDSKDINIERPKNIIANVYRSLYPKVDNDQLKNQKPGTKWKCPACGYTLTVFVSLADIPVHKCDPNSITQRELKRVS